MATEKHSKDGASAIGDWLMDRWCETHPIDGAWFAAMDRAAIGLETISRVLSRDATLRAAGSGDQAHNDHDTEGLHEAAISLASFLTHTLSLKRESQPVASREVAHG